MKPPLHVVFLLLAASAPCAQPVARAGAENATVSQPAAESVAWISVDGRAIRGSFVKLSGDAVVVLCRGKEFTIPLARLSEESVKQAKKLAVGQSESVIGDVVQMKFCRIPAGTFPMGSPETETGRVSDESRHQVKITRDFDLKETEVTWAEWNAVRNSGVNYGYTDMAAGRNGFSGDAGGRHPVTEISWWDAVKWCNLKSQIEGRTPVYYLARDFTPANIFKSGTSEPQANWDANGYRLPSEAEWEYACREGSSATNRAFYTGTIDHAGAFPIDRRLDSAGWYAGNSGGNTHPAGSKKENRYGLFDMHGNVAEWCWDWSPDLTLEGAPPVIADPKTFTVKELPEVARMTAKDPHGPDSGLSRIFRGGSWADPAKCCRAAYRGTRSLVARTSCFVGFRPARGSGPDQRR